MVSHQPQSIDYEKGLKELQSMFPSLDLEIIISVLENNNNKLETSIEFLLQIVSEQYKNQEPDKNDDFGNKEISIFGSSEQSNIEQNINKQKSVIANKSLSKNQQDNNNISQNKNTLNSNNNKINNNSQVVQVNKTVSNKDNNIYTKKKMSIGEKVKNLVGSIFKSNKTKKAITTTSNEIIKDDDNLNNDNYMKLSNKEDDDL